MILIEKMKMA